MWGWLYTARTAAERGLGPGRRCFGVAVRPGGHSFTRQKLRVPQTTTSTTPSTTPSDHPLSPHLTPDVGRGCMLRSRRDVLRCWHPHASLPSHRLLYSLNSESSFQSNRPLANVFVLNANAPPRPRNLDLLFQTTLIDIPPICLASTRALLILHIATLFDEPTQCSFARLRNA